MSRCDPNNDFDSNFLVWIPPLWSKSDTSNPFNASIWNEDVAELKWGNGPAMHSLVPVKASLASHSSSVSLGSIKEILNPRDLLNYDYLVPSVDYHPPDAMAIDSLVPCCTLPRSCEPKLVSLESVDYLRLTAKESARNVNLKEIDSAQSVEEDDREGKENHFKALASTRRSWTDAIHNQSKLKRENKINERMMMLHKLVPNSRKTTKVSILDEAIEYVQKLQAELVMYKKQRAQPVMLPVAMQQPLPMPMIPMIPMPMQMMTPMGMGIIAPPAHDSLPFFQPSLIMPPLSSNFITPSQMLFSFSAAAVHDRPPALIAPRVLWKSPPPY